MGYTLTLPDTPAPSTGGGSGGYTLTPPSTYDPTEGMSFLEKLLAGTGKAFVDTGRGARQLASKIGIGDADAIQQEIDASRATDAPLMNTGAGFAGNLLGNIAMGAAVPGGGATALTRALIAAGTGAAQSALQPVATGESRAVNTAVGAGLNALGSGVASATGKAFSGLKPGSPDLDVASQFANASDAPLSAGQLTGNDLVKRIEFWLAKFPGSKSWYNNLSGAQQDAVQKAIGSLTMDRNGGAALREAGAGKNFISDPDFVSALQSLPDQFKNLAGGMQPKGALATAKEYGGAPNVPNPALTGMGPSARAQAVAQGVPDLVGGEGATLPVGATLPMGDYQAIRSQLGRLSFGAAQGTPDAVGYKSLRDIFDATADRSLAAQGADPAALSQARNAYQVQKLLQPAEVQGADGGVTYSAPKVANVIDTAIRNGTIKNLPDDTQEALRQLMAFGRSVKPVSSSGTAENQFAKTLATLGIAGALGGSEYEWGDVLHHAPLAALSLYGAPKLSNALLQGAMRNGVNAPLTGATLAQILSRAGPAALPMVNQ